MSQPVATPAPAPRVNPRWIVEEQLTKREIADRLKVSLRTVSRVVLPRLKPVHRIGGQVRVPASALNKYLESQRQ